VQARLGIAMVDDLLEIGGAPCAPYLRAVLPRILLSCTCSSPPSYAPRTAHEISVSAQGCGCRAAPDDDLRQAALFGVGLAAGMGGAEFTPYAVEAVQVLRHVAGQPDARGEDKESATDNAVASLARVAARHADALPPHAVAEIWAEWLAYLPLKADVAEAAVVHKELARHVIAGHVGVLGAENGNLPRVVAVMAQVLETDLVDAEGTAAIRDALAALHARAPQLLDAACQALPPPLLQRLQKCATAPGAAPGAAPALQQPVG